MNPIVYHIVSGHAFFSGIGLILLTVGVSGRPTKTARQASRRRLICITSFIVGMFGVILSSTPIPYVYYFALAVATLGWLLAKGKSWRGPATVLLQIGWIGAAAIELPWHTMPAGSEAAPTAITVIGDSVSAGMEENDETWPSLLARQHTIQVQDISHVGETAGSALKRAQKAGVHSPCVILEIGGNDLLGSTTAEQFAIDLRSLLTFLAKPGREIILFELPLLPLHHEFGRIQRSLSSEFHVRLIPKRVFLRIIAERDATLDTIHLSPKGHQRMADLAWSLIQKP